MFYAFMFPRSPLGLGFKRDSTVFANPSFFLASKLEFKFSIPLYKFKKQKVFVFRYFGFLEKRKLSYTFSVLPTCEKCRFFHWIKARCISLSFGKRLSYIKRWKPINDEVIILGVYPQKGAAIAAIPEPYGVQLFLLIY